MENKVYFKNNWGFFIGDFNENQIHKHVAVQLSISIEIPIYMQNENSDNFEYKHYLIKSNTAHKLECKAKHLLLLFYPTSSIGHFLQNIKSEVISEYVNNEINSLQVTALKFTNDEFDFKEFIYRISKIISHLECHCDNNNHYGDDRIKKAISYLEVNYKRVISIDEICDIACLSESRFLHLFKQTTGITYRKAQQWYKVSKSFESLFDTTITDTAYEVGFADSAHFTKVCKETFGFTPKLIKQLNK